MITRTIWVCGACGKTARRREEFSDVSCMLSGVLCYEDSLRFDNSGRVVYADAVCDEQLLTHDQ